MKDYSIPREAILRLKKHPERILWLVQMLDMADDNGEFEMSYQQAALLFGTSKDCARRFLDGLTTRRHGFDTALTRFAICKSISYTGVRHDVDTALTRRTEERQPKKPRKTDKEKSIVTKVREVFEAFIKERFNESYYWQAKDAAAAKRLIKEIEHSRQNRDKPLPIDDDGILEGFRGYINSIQDQWLLEHFTMTQLASSFQQVKQQLSIQNGKSAIPTYKTKAERAEAALIQRQRESIVNKLSEIQHRWEQSQGG